MIMTIPIIAQNKFSSATCNIFFEIASIISPTLPVKFKSWNITPLGLKIPKLTNAYAKINAAIPYQPQNSVYLEDFILSIGFIISVAKEKDHPIRMVFL